MTSRTAAMGWVVAGAVSVLAFAFAFGYARARSNVNEVRRDYEMLQQRIEVQSRRNEELAAMLAELTRQLQEAQARMEALGQLVDPNASPAQPDEDSTTPN